MDVIECLVHPLIDKVVLDNLHDNELDLCTKRYVESAFNQKHTECLLESIEYLLLTNKEAKAYLARQVLIRTGSIKEVRDFCLNKRIGLEEMANTAIFLLNYLESPDREVQEGDFSEDSVFSVVIKLKVWDILLDPKSR